MDRNKRIIDCTPLEILSIGRQLIDYYFYKQKEILIDKYKKEDPKCQDQKEL
jgi:hypothetical protein